MELPVPQGEISLFFTGIRTRHGIIVLGTKEPLSSHAKSAMPARSRADARPTSVLETTAHDLRNPVSGILAASEFLLEDIKGGLEEHHLNLMRSIQTSSRLALELIDEMLETAPETSQVDEHAFSTDLVSVVNRSIALNRPLADIRSVRVEVQSNVPVPPLHIDPRKVAQAVHALLKNEIKCSRAGSHIAVSIGADGGEATVEVKDQGPGISAADLRRLFHTVGGRSKRGLMETRTAVALATVKRIVEGCGGSIRVESTIRKGSSVTLVLPLPADSGSINNRVDKSVASG